MRIIVHKRFTRRTHPSMSPENGTRQQHHVMSTQEDIRLLAGKQEEVMIRKPATSLEIDLLFLQARRTGIIRMPVPMEVSQDDYVDAHGPEDLHPLRAIIERVLVRQHFVQVHVKMAHEHLVS